MPSLAYVFFAIIAFGALIYVLMDGWDLGVGILFPLAAREQERDEMMESIVPFWDGNETWLVFGGVTLFAAFPAVYALALHVMYLPVMLMLFALVFRGISFEFRSHSNSKTFWNWTFALGSIVVAFSQGMILGKLVQGVELQHGPYGLTFTVSLFPLLCGVAMVSGYALLGSAWLIYKTDGATQTFGREVSRAAWLLTMSSFAVVCFWAPLSVTEVAKRWFTLPGPLIFGALAVALIAASIAFWRSIWTARSDARLLQLAVTMTVLAFIGFGGTIWPYVIPYHISIAQGAGDPASIKFALVGIIIVLPVVLTYQLFAYRVFRGKAEDLGVSYESPMLSGPGIHSRHTHEGEPHLHLS
ncbi:MAG: cytochrome d ubiquinol oxidase subunit II [Candidatus Binataceae bacterium]